MRECISIHVGQGGIQTGNACWELYWYVIYKFSCRFFKEMCRICSPAWILSANLSLLIMRNLFQTQIRHVSHVIRLTKFS